MCLGISLECLQESVRVENARRGRENRFVTVHLWLERADLASGKQLQVVDAIGHATRKDPSELGRLMRVRDKELPTACKGYMILGTKVVELGAALHAQSGLETVCPVIESRYAAVGSVTIRNEGRGITSRPRRAPARAIASPTTPAPATRSVFFLVMGERFFIGGNDEKTRAMSMCHTPFL
ncbi:hypothetical protein PsorP6_003256 [Peronosclerospora sorghi]|uniref:Uncharacterized protein n=1 Tax=Peronosclerospora sorghi TaxID=230839 RepID=A0ACC0VNC3_9STRA|nr:hypothetical protein PsorP6_003256 [Peronosclerospora sorghi]